MASDLTREDLERMQVEAHAFSSYLGRDVDRTLALVEELAAGLVASQPAIIPGATLSGRYLIALAKARALLPEQELP